MSHLIQLIGHSPSCNFRRAATRVCIVEDVYVADFSCRKSAVMSWSTSANPVHSGQGRQPYRGIFFGQPAGEGDGAVKDRVERPEAVNAFNGLAGLPVCTRFAAREDSLMWSMAFKAR